MKNLKKRTILIFVFFFLWLTAFPGDLSARDAVWGKLAAGIPSAPEAVQDKFAIGQKIDFSETDALSRAERRDLVLGKISEKKAKQLGSRRKYLKSRGKAQLAGKGFEEFTVQRVQKKLPHGMRIEATAILGAPHNPADLVLTKDGKVVDRFQLKMGERTSINALKNPKYEGQKILTSPDTLRKIQSKLRKGRYMPDTAKFLKNALAKGRLTSEIKGIRAASSLKIFRWTRKQINRQWRKSFKRAMKRFWRFEFMDEIEDGIGDLSIKRTRKQISRQWRKSFKGGMKHFGRFEFMDEIEDGIEDLSIKLRGKAKEGLFVKIQRMMDNIAVPLAILDVVRGGQIIYMTHAEYYSGNLDRDLAQLKVLIGSVAVAVGTLDLIVSLVPNPITMGVSIVVGVVTLGLEVALWILDKIQERRIRNQHEMICRLQELERPDALRRLLLRQLNTGPALQTAG